MVRNVHITDHALLYVGNRTLLSVKKIIEANQYGAFVYLGYQRTKHRLIWDPYKGDAVIFLVDDEKDEDVVVSIWERHFVIAKSLIQPTDEVVNEAKRIYEEKMRPTNP